jgi:hypothetical protein
MGFTLGSGILPCLAEANADRLLTRKDQSYCVKKFGVSTLFSKVVMASRVT